SLSLITPRPPSSTLFPYTTLFRSRRCRGSARLCSGIRAVTQAHSPWRQEHRQPAEHPRPLRSHRIALVRSTRLAGGTGARLGRGDRKSTRLNSSHLGISYAVFCLK